MLAIIQVGHNDASDRYIRNKVKAIEKEGMRAEVINLPQDCTTLDVLDAITIVGRKTECRAIMVQLPLPDHINKDVVLRSIPPHMDIDGLNPCGDVSHLAKELVERNGGICTPVPGGVGKWTVRELIIRLSEMEGHYGKNTLPS